MDHPEIMLCIYDDPLRERSKEYTKRKGKVSSISSIGKNRAAGKRINFDYLTPYTNISKMN